MERLRFVKLDVLSSHGRKDLQNFWGSAYKAIHHGTQGLASALKRSTSAHSCRSREEPRRKQSIEVTQEIINETAALNGIHRRESLKCSMAEYGWGLSEESLKKAAEELKEDPINRKHTVQAVRNLISTRPDIEFLRVDDAFILRFLRARKFDVRQAFQLYCRYFEYRKANEGLFENFTASESGIKQALLDGFPGVLASPDQQGHRVLVFFTGHWDHCRYGLLAIYRALLLTLENLVDDEVTQIHGFLLIVDWSGFTFRQSSLLQPKLLRLIIEGLQDCFPGRFAGIHFVNQPWYIEAALTLIKSFLKEKTKDKIYLHGNNLTTLHHHIAKDILPSELGGSGPPYNTVVWAKQLLGDETFAYSDRHIFWPTHNETPKSNSSPLRAVHSVTFPSDLSKSRSMGRPSLTELDEEFFLS